MWLLSPVSKVVINSLLFPPDRSHKAPKPTHLSIKHPYTNHQPHLLFAFQSPVAPSTTPLLSPPLPQNIQQNMSRMPSDKEYIPSRYTQLSNIYNQGEFEDIQPLLEHLTSSCSYNTMYPILKLLRAVCRCLLINELESIFFAYVIQTNGWKIHDSIIQKHKDEVKDIVFYTTHNEDYKALTLYLLLCGYTSKYYLNEFTEMYSPELEKICPDFKTVFSQWVKQEAYTTLKIYPKSLNKVYKQIYLSVKAQPTQNNYNSLVDNILVICPSYNPQREKQLCQVKQQKPLPKVIPHQSLNVSMTIANLPILSSSGFLQQIGIMPFTNSLMLTESIQNKKNSFGLNSSEYGINNLTFLDDQNPDINDFVIGFRECHSDNEEELSKVGAVVGNEERSNNNSHNNTHTNSGSGINLNNSGSSVAVINPSLKGTKTQNNGSSYFY